jgi:hypothetical protein
MPRRNRSNPFLAWHSLGLRMAETMAASSHVISHRTARRNTAAQLFEMGSEKVLAAMEASHAMSRHLAAMPRDPFAMWTAWPGMLASGLAPFHRRVKSNARRASRRR